MAFNPPAWLGAALQLNQIVVVKELPATWVFGFFSRQRELGRFLDTLDFTKIEKGLWVSWPKKTSHVPTDLTEHSFRQQVLPLGWVDVKVAAIDETWSALKFLRRTNAQ